MSELALLELDGKQTRPSRSDIEAMLGRLSLAPVDLPEQPFTEFLGELRKSHIHGGAYIKAFDVSPDTVFDWFASRNRLSDEGLLDAVLVNVIVRATLPELQIPESQAASGLTLANSFLLDSRFGSCLYMGGAYWTAGDSGRHAKMLGLNVCEAMFDLRYGEISLWESFDAWTPWFRNIAWDVTEVVFDRRLRRLWVFAVTDTD